MAQGSGGCEQVSLAQQLEEGHWWDEEQVREVQLGLRTVDEFKQYPCKARWRAEAHASCAFCHPPLPAGPAQNPDACSLSRSTLSFSCAAGYTGPLCAVCAPDYGSVGSFVCTECTGPAEDWTALVFTMLLVLTLVGFGIYRILMQRQKPSLAGSHQRDVLVTTKIIFNFLQASAVLLGFDLRWPASIRGFFNFAGTAGSLSTRASFMDCALQWDAFQLQLFFFLMPIIMLSIPAVAIGVVMWQHRAKVQAWQGQIEAGATVEELPPPAPLQVAGTSPMAAFSTVSLLLLFLMYPSISQQAMGSIACTTVGGTEYLATDYSLRCGTPEHNASLGLAIFQIIFISVGFPAGSAYLLHSLRHRLDKDSVRRKYEFLYSGYRTEVAWYESVQMLKKALLVSVGSLIVGTDMAAIRVFVGLLIMGAALVLHFSLRPFVDLRQQQLESLSLIVTTFMLLVGLLFAGQGVEGRAGIGITLAALAVTGAAVFLLLAVVLVAVDVYKAAKDLEIAERLKKNFSKSNIRLSGISKLGQRLTLRMASTRNLALQQSAPRGARGPTPAKSPGRMTAPGRAHGGKRAPRASVVKLQSMGVPERALADWKARQAQASKSSDSAAGQRDSKEAQRSTGPRRRSSSFKGVQSGGSGKGGGGRSAEGEGSQKPRTRRSHSTSELSEAAKRARDAPSSGGFTGFVDMVMGWANSVSGGGGAAKAPAQGSTATPAEGGAGAASGDAAAMRALSKLQKQASAWETKQHPDTGQTYWFNTSTRAVEYTRPSILDEVEARQEEIDRAWSISAHPQKGWRVYVNKITGERRPNRPRGIDPLPGELWDVHIHPSYELPYFLNKSTGEAAWTQPDGFVPTRAQQALMRQYVSDRAEEADSDSDGDGEGFFSSGMATEDDAGRPRALSQYSNPLHSAGGAAASSGSQGAAGDKAGEQGEQEVAKDEGVWARISAALGSCCACCSSRKSVDRGGTGGKVSAHNPLAAYKNKRASTTRGKRMSHQATEAAVEDPSEAERDDGGSPEHSVAVDIGGGEWHGAEEEGGEWQGGEEAADAAEGYWGEDGEWYPADASEGEQGDVPSFFDGEDEELAEEGEQEVLAEWGDWQRFASDPGDEDETYWYNPVTEETLWNYQFEEAYGSFDEALQAAEASEE